MSERIHIKFRCRSCNKTHKVTQPAIGFDFIISKLSGADENGKSDISVMCPLCGDHVRLGFGRPWFVRRRDPAPSAEQSP